MAGTARIEAGATITPSKLDLVQGWIARQRWFLGSGQPTLDRVGSYRFVDPAGEVGIETLLVRDTSAQPPVLYQVPLTYRAAPLPDVEPIGTVEHSVLGARYVYDGPHDPVYVAELVRTVVEAHTEAAVSAGENDTHVVGEPARPGRTLHVRSSRVLTGEQSNTSAIVETDDAPVIVKVFRVLHSGANPDVVVQGALAAHGSELVPTPVGALSGRWPGGSGHLAFAQEFLPGVQDAWRVALTALADGVEFTDAARALGEATGQVHRDLAAALGTRPATQADRQALRASMAARHAAAAAAAPALRDEQAAADALLDTVLHTSWPALQRIHGDYHLGQVISVPGRGWVLLDFEGEPLRPLAERTLPDLPHRDIAGMLRSFDYAAGQHERRGADPHLARAWADAARTAFLDGYSDAAGTDPRRDSPELLAALELDKALYEVAYEQAHRPDWLDLPVAAVTRLVHLAPPAPDTQEPPMPEPTQSTTPTPSAQVGSAIGTAPKDASAPDPTGGPKHEKDLPDADALQRLVAGHHHDPHSLLGPHPADGGTVVRVLAPNAQAVRIHLEGTSTVAARQVRDGVWQALLPGVTTTPDYRVGIDYGDGFEHVGDDPYRFLPTLGDTDVHLIGEGRHERLWEVLGSHVRTYPGPLGDTTGTSFAVWAPNAVAVRVAGDFNTWDSARHPMRSMGSSGLWELFVPGVGAGTRYKYEIYTQDGRWIAKADPMARATEVPPATASVVTDSQFAWSDDEWVQARDDRRAHESPMSIYEVHLGSWRQGLSYTELADQLVAYVTDLGFTHVELLPVAEHPYGPSWGYQVTGYYAPTSRFGSPDEFRHLVDTLHAHGIGVILDWVPAHFPKDAFALAKFDGRALYEHPDPRKGDQPDWGTHVFDFGRPQVRNFLVANALYWLEEFHVDGLRVDAVASMLYLDYSRKDGEWVPNEFGGREHLEAVQFLQETNATVYKHHPGALMIAEESTSWPGVTRPTHVGGLGFGFKWNMGWMHDSLAYVEHEPIHRQYHHHQMTFGMVYAYSENFILPISHDEVVYGKGSLLRKMPGDRWQQLANVRAYLAFMWSFPGKQLLFMGQEFAQEAEWADGQSLDWWLLDQPAHLSVHQMTKAMNAAYRAHPALWQLDCDPAGFAWIDANDASGNTFSFLRYGTKAEGGVAPAVAVVANFAGTPHHQYRLGLPEGGTWREVFNTDAHEWGGSGVGNMGEIHAEPIPWHGQPFSAEITVPPLATVWFTPQDGSVARADRVARQERPELAAAAQAAAESSAAADAAERPELRA